MFQNPKIKQRLEEYMFCEGGPKPFMKNKEIECIKSYLNKDNIMLEIGAGSSTLYYPKYVKEYYSIEHMMKWYKLVKNMLRKYPDINKKVILKYISSDLDIMSTEDSSLKYSTYIDYINKLDVPKFDIILIDGAARDHCAMESIKHMDKNSILFFHDYYTKKYEPCHWIEEHFDIVEKIKTGETLVVMKIK